MAQPLHHGRLAPQSDCSRADRVLRSHQVVNDAARAFSDGTPGGGVRALCFAASTHLALAIGADKAGDFFEMLARVTREVGKPKEPGDAA